MNKIEYTVNECINALQEVNNAIVCNKEKKDKVCISADILVNCLNLIKLLMLKFKENTKLESENELLINENIFLDEKMYNALDALREIYSIRQDEDVLEVIETLEEDDFYIEDTGECDEEEFL